MPFPCLLHLQTSVQDLHSIGRLVGIPFFFSLKALDEEKADMAELRKAKASLGEDDPLNIDEDLIGQMQVKIALKIQGQFERRILRRTIESTNWEGKQLIDLPPCHHHIVLLKLQPFEREIHTQLAEQMREEYVIQFQNLLQLLTS